MVCKEEVLLWFKDLESYKRIDVLYELLNMCLPFELRFIGTCVEELGRHTFQELRGPELTANDMDKLAKDPTLEVGLAEKSVRHRVLIYLSLLSSRNSAVANWLFAKLLRVDDFEQLHGDDQQSEYLLLFTMALHHPAFTFDQKQHFSKVLMQIIACRDNCNNSKSNVYGCPPGFSYPTQQNKMLIQDVLPPPPPAAAAVIHNIPQLDFLPLNRSTGFACEVSQFVTPITPLVNQSESPNHSRSTSPHHMTIRTPAPPVVNLPPPIEIVPSTVLMPPLTEPPPAISQPTSLYQNSDQKLPEEELPADDKWRPLLMDLKSNGIRFPYPQQRNVIDQFQVLNIDQQQSNSSSNSSPNPSPPGTPSGAANYNRCASGDCKNRMNGVFDATSPPPPPPPPFNSVPYNYTQTTVLPPPPNRSIFHFPPNYRPPPPPFTTPYPFQTDSAATFPATYTFPYIIYSSNQFARTAAPPPATTCYNCGAVGHVGSECVAQNVDEITQNKTYQLEYAATVPDRDKS